MSPVIEEVSVVSSASCSLADTNDNATRQGVGEVPRQFGAHESDFPRLQRQRADEAR